MGSISPEVLNETSWALDRLDWMRKRNIWPHGKRYLWTDAFGLLLLISLHHETGEPGFLDEAERLVDEVDRVLGRERGIRIGEAPDRDGQYFHYLAMWIYALTRFGEVRNEYRERAIRLVREIHSAFVIPGRGVIWKMEEDLSAPYPGYGLGALDPFHGYVVYRLLDPEGLAPEIDEMRKLVESNYRHLRIDQDLGLGMMLWMTHFFPDEEWAIAQREISLEMLEELWIDPPGYFCRARGMKHMKFTFTNAGVSIGLQSAGSGIDRVRKLHRFFDSYESGDEYDIDPITHVMLCCSHMPGELIQAE
ncbi:MAG: hypothetical protein R3338_13315 [Thermoanaerobaculia bacterium]|nr:hypothetical protein [Thermoanaerobaculia bacterium]